MTKTSTIASILLALLASSCGLRSSVIVSNRSDEPVRVSSAESSDSVVIESGESGVLKHGSGHLILTGPRSREVIDLHVPDYEIRFQSISPGSPARVRGILVDYGGENEFAIRSQRVAAANIYRQWHSPLPDG